MSVGPSAQATFAATLVDEWIRAGVRHAVVSPGSRSTPLVLALAARPELAIHVRLDERGAGFFAVGIGLDSGRPAVVCTTSGTAAAELHPAVVEAHHAGVPLIACTADRPPELHHVGANQTIDQAGLFGPAVRWACDPGVAVAEHAGTWRALAARAVAEACSGPSGPGPVHLNLAFGEPLVAAAGPLPPGRPDGGPLYGPPETGTSARPVADPPALRRRERGVVVAGAGAGPPGAVVALAERLGWPLLADPRSGCRLDHPCVVAAADALARSPSFRAASLPETVVQLGSPWTSRALAGWLAEAAAAGSRVVAVDPWWRWTDPDRVVTEFHRAPPGPWLAAALDRVEGTGGEAGGWLAHWRTAESGAQRAVDDVLAEDGAGRGGGLSEPALARRLLASVGAGTHVVAASSMPVRELEWFAPTMADPPRVSANRGASGIDGVCSTAQGAAAASGPVVGVVGDLAFFHDVSSLVRPPSPSPPSPIRPGPAPAGTGCTLVVVDNGGGGIFNFLPQAQAVDAPDFERLFGTPQAPDVLEVARGFGLDAVEVRTADELADALGAAPGRGALSVVRVRVPGRAQNVALHERIQAAVDATLRGGEVAGQR